MEIGLASENDGKIDHFFGRIACEFCSNNHEVTFIEREFDNPYRIAVYGAYKLQL